MLKCELEPMDYRATTESKMLDEYFEDTTYCPYCDKEIQKDSMRFTYDCHGIPFRYVCPDCYEKLMAKGYDGEHYTEADECIDYDY